MDSDLQKVRKRADVLIDMQRLDEAEKVLLEYLKNDPKAFIIRYRLHNLYLQKKRPDPDLESLLDTFIADYPDDPLPYQQKAHFWYNKGCLKPAIKTSYEALERSPYDSYIHAFIGAIYYQYGKKRKARKYLERSLELNPKERLALKIYQHLTRNSWFQKKKSQKARNVLLQQDPDAGQILTEAKFLILDYHPYQAKKLLSMGVNKFIGDKEIIQLYTSLSALTHPLMIWSYPASKGILFDMTEIAKAWVVLLVLNIPIFYIGNYYLIVGYNILLVISLLQLPLYFILKIYYDTQLKGRFDLGIQSTWYQASLAHKIVIVLLALFVLSFAVIPILIITSHKLKLI